MPGEPCLAFRGRARGSPDSANLAVLSGWESFVTSTSVLSPGLFCLNCHSVVSFIFGFSRWIFAHLISFTCCTS